MSEKGDSFFSKAFASFVACGEKKEIGTKTGGLEFSVD
jgi:hypothetical protein